MKPPARGPCDECPWSRTSARGWLGPSTADEWVALAHSDEPIACHLTIKDEDDLDAMRHCAGADIYRSNVAKRPRCLDHEQLGRNPVAVFDSPMQFKEHHER